MMRRIGLVLLIGICAAATANAQPDVIVGDLQDLESWGSSGSIYAYSVGTTSCNIGDEVLLWDAATNEHPVIGQEMYKYRAGRFEQIGISWLKHAFCALSLDLCSPCSATDCSTLGVGCSDPYTAGRNGQQSNLGPRSQVNAYTGEYPYPFTAPPFDPIIGRRIQVSVDNVNPALNPGARYVVEGHYVTHDDAAAGNGENNVSWREIELGTSSGSYPMQFLAGAATHREVPAIYAWQSFDPLVNIVESNIAGEGLLILGYKVSVNGDGTYHYEYALYNMNSDIAVRAFSLPVHPSVTVSNAYMNGVPYHSGEPFDSTPWPVTVSGGTLEFATETYTANPNANALRWSRLYNFRFDCDAPPTSGFVTYKGFKSSASVSAAAQVPAEPSIVGVSSLECVSAVSTVELSWQNGDSYTDIELRRNSVLIATLPGDATSYSDPDVTIGADYAYSVQAFQGAVDTEADTCNILVEEPAQLTRGDANVDGNVDVSDAVFMLAALFVAGSPQPQCGDSADSNDDGVFDISDAVYSLFSLFLPGAEPIPEPSSCGYDLTLDSLGCEAFDICP